jgi:hypothetical protein
MFAIPLTSQEITINTGSVNAVWGGITGTLSTQLDLQSALDAKLASTAYTAADVLAKLLTVDGTGSLLDSDLLDGQNGSYYLAWANFTGVPATFTPSAHTHLQSEITDLTANETLDHTSISILTQHSLTGGGTIAATRTLNLVNDVASPGNLKLYGTDGTGVRGWYDQPTGSSAVWGGITGTLSSQTDLQTALDAKLNSASYTAADVLAKLLTVDGSGSGIDADLLDGNSSAFYALASHTHTLNDLSDVIITTPSNGQVLKYNGTNWINDTDLTGGGGGALNDLTDVIITAAATNDVLQFDGANWVDLPLTLNQIISPTASKSFNMGDNTLSFLWVAPTSIGLELEATGAFTGDLLHIHQHTGNPGAGTDLVHIESEDADVTPFRVVISTVDKFLVNGSGRILTHAITDDGSTDLQFGGGTRFGGTITTSSFGQAFQFNPTINVNSAAQTATYSWLFQPTHNLNVAPAAGQAYVNLQCIYTYASTVSSANKISTQNLQLSYTIAASNVNNFSTMAFIALTAGTNNSAGTIDNVVGINIPELLKGSVTTRAIQSTLTSTGTSVWFLYSSGNASSYHEGKILIGKTTDDGINLLQVDGSLGVLPGTNSAPGINFGGTVGINGASGIIGLSTISGVNCLAVNAVGQTTISPTLNLTGQGAIFTIQPTVTVTSPNVTLYGWYNNNTLKLNAEPLNPTQNFVNTLNQFTFEGLVASVESIDSMVGYQLSPIIGANNVQNITIYQDIFLGAGLNSGIGTIGERRSISIPNPTLVGTTRNSGIYSNIALNGTINWNLYLIGAARNYIAGNVQMGNATPTTLDPRLQVNGNVEIYGVSPQNLIRATNAVAALEIQTVTGSADINRAQIRMFDATGTLRIQALNDAGTGGGDVLDLVRNTNAFTQLRFGNATTPVFIADEGTDTVTCKSALVVNTDALVVNSSKNVLIGTVTDGGFKLDVVGTARISGAVTLTTQLGISSGGTGQTTANAALNALLPTQTGHNGHFLKSNATDTSWAALTQADISDLTANETVDHSTVSIATQHSITGGGDLTATRTLNLVNDLASPGNSMLYGTDGAGVKGWYAQPSGGGSLDALSDVVISTPALHHILRYNGSNWVNATPDTLNIALDNLNDVALVGLATNHVLRYNGSNWANAVPTLATIDDITDVTLVSPSIGQVLRYNGSNWANATNTPTPGGSATQVQYHDGSALAGDADFTWDASGNILTVNGKGNYDQIQINVGSTPSTPGAGIVELFGTNKAGFLLPAFISSSGQNSPLQPGIYNNKVRMYYPTTGTTGTGALGTAWTSSSTVSHPTPASTDKWTQIYRTRWQSSTTAGTATGVRETQNSIWRGNAAGLGGFYFFARFGQQINLNGGQMFVGLKATAALAGDPSALTNMIGMGYDAADSSSGNWQFMRNDGSGTATKVDLGANGPRNTTHFYDLHIYCAPSDSKITVRIVNEFTGNVLLDNVEYTTDLPTSTTFMAMHAVCRNGAVASAVNVEVSCLYCLSDF